MKRALGIEIGGTKLQAGIGLHDDRLIGLARQSVELSKGAEGIREAIPSLVERALEDAGCSIGDLCGIGVGFGGPVDSKQGITLLSHQVEGWDRFPLLKWFEERWDLPVSIQNDSSIAGYAEAILGAGKGCHRMVYMNIGSGIGGGLITGRVLDEGQGLGSAEIGHTWVPDPETGEPEKLELVCSGWSIARRMREALERGESSMVLDCCDGKMDRLTAKTVYTAAERSDLLANTILEETCECLAIAIGNVITLLHPERLALGGGVSLMGPLFWDSLLKKVKRYVFGPFVESYEIVPAALEEDVVVVGAILLGLKIGNAESL